jgi:hypothetical protein
MSGSTHQETDDLLDQVLEDERAEMLQRFRELTESTDENVEPTDPMS